MFFQFIEKYHCFIEKLYQLNQAAAKLSLYHINCTERPFMIQKV